MCFLRGALSPCNSVQYSRLWCDNTFAVSCLGRQSKRIPNRTYRLEERRLTRVPQTEFVVSILFLVTFVHALAV